MKPDIFTKIKSALVVLMMLAVPFTRLIAGTGGPEDFPMLWEIKSPYEANEGSEVSPDGKFILVADDKGAALHDGKDGKVIWANKYKDVSSVGFSK